MASCDELIRQLQAFKEDRRSEYPLQPIEKWMCGELGVKRLKNTGGSKIRYEHAAMAELKSDGIFTVHVAHRGKREVIFRSYFLNFLYRPILHIIEYMRREGLCDG